MNDETEAMYQRSTVFAHKLLVLLNEHGSDNPQDIAAALQMALDHMEHTAGPFP